MNERVSDHTQENKAMISLNMRPGVSDYTLYVDSNKLQNFKVDLGLRELSNVVLKAAKKQLKQKFLKMCKREKMLYLGFANNCVVMLDAKNILDGANNYLEGSREAGHPMPRITQIVVTDELPEMCGRIIPHVHPTRWFKNVGFKYKFKPNTKCVFNKEGDDSSISEEHPSIYHVNKVD